MPGQLQDPLIDRRPDARIVRSALDEVTAIQTLLADVYKDVGGGRTLQRELVQNADDARATRLVFVVLERGWPRAHNTLLRGPALLVANDGPFPAKDRDALHQAIGGAKAEDVEKIGRFGVGLKSVFHICEAIAYLGAENGVLRPGALNPWAGTGEGGDADPLHPEWDGVDDDDLRSLLEAATGLFETFEDGFLQWIPLRREAHLDRAPERPYGLGQLCPDTDEVASWFGRTDSLALLLAQCAHLSSIEADRALSPEELPKRAQLARVVRPDFGRREWVGRFEDDVPPLRRQFSGRIAATNKAWLVTGRERLGVDSLRELRVRPDWPRDPHWRGGRCIWLPRKALGHAAVTVVRPDKTPSPRGGARLRWAVFLPLDDAANPGTNPVVETVGSRSDGDVWDIVMHGYFWPSHDRRSIPGVTDDDAGTGDGAVRTRWNRAVRDELLLPLLPSALADVVNEVPESAARDVLEAVVGSRTVRTHCRAITQEDVLLPVLTSAGVVWKAHDPGAVRILSVPMWRNASSVVREVFTASTKSDGIVFIDADAPRIGGNIGDWPLDEFERMLSSLSVQELRTYEGLIWAETLVRHVLGSPADTNDRRAAAAARWIVDRIREGVLTTVPERAPQDAENDSRSAWRRLLESLPSSWLIDAPVASQQAVAELATKQAVGPGLVPIPLGRRPARGVRPTREHVDTALLELGTLLSDTSRVSQRTHLSRLLLAETLLSVRGDLDFDESLRHMPLLRAQRLPDEEDEAWSIATLRLRTERRRVFARTVADDGEGGPVDNPIDPKRAVTDLAEATGESAWLVDATVAAAANVPTPTTEALSFAILQSKEIQSRPIDRAGLIQRLAGDAVTTGNADIRNAIRALLTGRSANPGDQVLPLFYVRSQDSQGTAHRRTLEILLRLLGRSWCAIDARLIEPLAYGLVSNLGVKVIDAGVLQRLLDECLGEGIDWHALERDDILHLITHLHGNAAEVRRAWRAMPLHRDHQGGRGPIDDRTWRLGGQLRPPRELEAELRVLDPDPELVDLYVAVPILDDDGILRAMLESRRPQQFADRIVRALQSNDGSITLPRDQPLLNLLRETGWLPSRHNDDGIIPNRLIVLPTELAASVAPLAAAGGLGDHRLTADVSSSFWHAAVDAVHEVVGRPDTARQIKRLASALDCATVAAVDGSAHIVLPATSSVDANLVDDALQSPLGDSHLGWALLRTAERALGVSGRPLDDAPSTAREAILSLARSLKGPLPASRQIEILRAISATSPANESRTGRLFRVLLQSFSLSDCFFDDVVPHIALPTQDGVWRDTREIARSESGVARRHRVLSELRPLLRLDASGAVRQDRARRGTATDVVDTAKALETFFAPWVQRVPHAAIGAFLSLLGKGKNGAISNLAQHWLGDDVSVDGMLEGLLGTAEYPSSVRVFCSGRVARGPRIEVLNLLGEWVEVDAVEDAETIFAADPELLDHWRGDFWNPQLGDLELGSARRADSITPLKFWNLQLRNIDPGNRTAHDLIALLGGTVEWWAARVLRVDVQVARSWWSRWGTGSQAQVAPVQASILAHLPLTLRQLDVNECIPLRDALRDAERAQRRREQAPSSKIREAIAAERSALDTLAALIREVPEHQLFLWQRVQELIHRFGYREDSVLLELAQNADDALAQAAEIAGDGLPANVRRFVVRVHERGGVSIVDVIYHGRPVNDTGGAAFAAGRDRQWDQDLYFMMLLNLSGKPGEIPGHATPSSTTGRFGLGFKSVHLVSTTPSVVSGFLAFSIAGGLLPVEQPMPNDPEFSPVEGHRGTRIRLPLRLDLAASDLLAGLFRRFAYTRAVLPAFARQLREIVVDGGPYAGVSVFDGEPVENAPGWSVSKVTTELAGHGRWRIMRFRRADAEVGSGTTALVVGLRDGIATTFPSDLPFV